MTSTVEIGPSEVRSGDVGEKRPAAEDVGVSLIENDVLPPPHKRIKGGSEQDLKKVAEMVLVLAAMGKIRGGRGATVSEKELMADARNRLAKVCEDFAPKDVFPGDAFGNLIEDLGLNKLNEQRIGFRRPKISIANKLLISKRKMEKAEDLSLPSIPHSAQRPQRNFVAAAESQSAAHSVQTSHLVKPNRISITAGNILSTSPLGHVTTSNVTTPHLSYQLPTSEIRPIVSTSLPSNHLGAAALPRPHLRSNGSAHPSQVQVNHSAAKSPTWTVQPHSVQAANVGSNNKVPVTMALRVEGPTNVKPASSSQAVSSRPVIAQTTNYVQPPPVANAHAETAKVVQKILQARVSERPVWDPPSRDYMNKALTCQICMSAVTDTDSILICDSCEKGYHLKCLQMTHQTGVSKVEWHCGKCLSLSSGKPLPPKYGRVMRNTETTKMSSDSPSLPSTKINRIDASGDKVPETIPTAVAGNNNSYYQVPGNKTEDVKGIKENDNMTKSSLSSCVSSMDSSGAKTSGDKVIDMKPNSSSKSELVTNSSDESQMVYGQPVNLRVLNDEARPVAGNSEDTRHDDTLNNENKLKKQDVLHDNPSEIADTLNNANQLQEQEVLNDNPSEITIDTTRVVNPCSSPVSVHDVNWVGDSIQLLDDKIFYESCCISGHLYKATSYVLVHFENDKLIPSKLQAMWEDKNNKKKWITVNQCYFPGDLPEAVGRPCGLESREVYESTKSRTMMAGLIESPCEVLPPRKFEEEVERRTQLNDNLPPLYLCKWIYDEAKGLFRDISC